MFNQIRGVYISNLHQFQGICAIKYIESFCVQVGLFGKSGWICFPVSGSVVESGLYNEDAFQYRLQKRVSSEGWW